MIPTDDENPPPRRRRDEDDEEEENTQQPEENDDGFDGDQNFQSNIRSRQRSSNARPSEASDFYGDEGEFGSSGGGIPTPTLANASPSSSSSISPPFNQNSENRLTSFRLTKSRRRRSTNTPEKPVFFTQERHQPFTFVPKEVIDWRMKQRVSFRIDSNLHCFTTVKNCSCSTRSVFEHWCRPTRCGQGASLCQVGMLGRSTGSPTKSPRVHRFQSQVTI